MQEKAGPISTLQLPENDKLTGSMKFRDLRKLDLHGAHLAFNEG